MPKWQIFAKSGHTDITNYFSHRDGEVEVEAFDRMLSGVVVRALKDGDGLERRRVTRVHVHEVRRLAALAVLRWSGNVLINDILTNKSLNCFLNGPSSVSLSFIFGLFKQTIEIFATN